MSGHAKCRTCNETFMRCECDLDLDIGVRFEAWRNLKPGADRRFEQTVRVRRIGEMI